MGVSKERNQTIDIIRGVAMLLVILGHTMTGCTENSQNSFLFNIVWTLQMPLFMLISGYVNKYSKPITSFKALSGFFLKKTRAYLLPFAVWTFIVRGVIFKQSGYLEIKSLIYNMDDGYWFLFSVWSIVIILGIANFLTEKCMKKRNEYIKLAGITFFYICGMAVLGLIGYSMGLSFLCIKLTLYYMPFYYAGYLYGKLEGKLNKINIFADVKELGIAFSLVMWIFLMNRYNFYEIGDSGWGIILRALASLSGCIAVCGLVGRVYSRKEYPENTGRITKILVSAGKNSLEIYLIHYLLLSMVRLENPPVFSTPAGVVLSAANYLLTLFVAFMVINLIKSNKVLDMVLFGKRQ